MANRRHFGLATTWLPHLLGNSFTLLLPEIYAAANQVAGLSDRWSVEPQPTLAALRRTLDQLVRDNPDYVHYVAPVALAYIVSQPHFNIYRGRWGELNLWGFGLDSIPHSTTAYALTVLVYDGLDRLVANSDAGMRFKTPLQWLASHKIVTSGAVVLGATLIYETSEYLIHRAELKAANYDKSRINMLWSLKDALFDALSNGLGWAGAVLCRRL